MTAGFLLAFKSGDLKPCWTVKLQFKSHFDWTL